MFFGVPPSMIGDNSGSDSNWGTGLQQKADGFGAYTLDDHLVMWEEEIGAMIADPKVYARFNRAAMVRTDINTRYGRPAERRVGKEFVRKGSYRGSPYQVKKKINMTP